MSLALAASDASAQERRIARSTLEDKIRGGWAGQMIGVAFGAPTEFRWNGRIVEGPIAWEPGQVAGSINQDDLYVEMTFAEVLDRVGLDARSRDFGEMFRDSRYELWHANASARRLLQNGLESPATGNPENNPHANDIDFQIESDFIGLMTPGLPREANRFAAEVGRVMNAGDGLYGGMFFSGMYAAAFFESDPRKVVEEGLRSIPAESGYARIVRDVLSWSREQTDWKKTWQLIKDKWDRDDLCPEGALQDFNIDARLNGAYVVLGLLYGGGDFSRTLDVATRAGQDSDCNPSSAAGILGTILGYSSIPDQWRSGIPAIAGTRFAYTRYSFDEIVASTMNRALAVVARAGGKVEGDENRHSASESGASAARAVDAGSAGSAHRVDRAGLDLSRVRSSHDSRQEPPGDEHPGSRSEPLLLGDGDRALGHHVSPRRESRHCPRRQSARRSERVGGRAHPRRGALSRHGSRTGRSPIAHRGARRCRPPLGGTRVRHPRRGGLRRALRETPEPFLMP